MTEQSSTGWEPDPRRMGNWRSMFEQPRRDGQPPGATYPSPAAPPDDSDLRETEQETDQREYHPWILQRGRSRPAMMLSLRRFDLRSGMWQGWGLPYPSLHAVEYMGDRMLSLDFGARQFVIEGRGLMELARHIEQGAVVSIQEYAEPVWAYRPEGPIVAAIQRAGIEGPPSR